MSKALIITGSMLLFTASICVAGQQQMDTPPQPPNLSQSPQSSGAYPTRIRRAPMQQGGGQLQRVPNQSAPIPPAMEEMQRRGAMRINPNQTPQMPAREPAPAQGQGLSRVQAQPVQVPQQQTVQPAGSAAFDATMRPPNPPRISFAGGQLTVIADNSALSDILRAVGRTTGAHLEGSAPDAERVFGQFGPGSTRDVLNSLLTGSRYDYVLLGSLDAPGSVNRIVLSPHAAGASNGTAVAGGPNQGMRPNYNPPQPVEEENNVEDNGDNAPEANSPSEQTPQPEPQPQAQPENNANQPNGQQQPNQIKTPEQLLQELQRLRQQQQQQQQNQQGQPQENPQ